MKNVTCNPGEQWKLIPQWESYEISTLGRVRRSENGRFLKTHVNDKGYPVVHLRMGGREKQLPIHTAILTAFVGPKPSSYHQAAHGDGDKSSSVLSNLRWATVRDNIADKRLHGTQLFGEKIHNAVLTVAQVKDIRSRPVTPGSGMKLADEFGVSFQTISLVRLERIWRHA